MSTRCCKICGKPSSRSKVCERCSKEFAVEWAMAMAACVREYDAAELMAIWAASRARKAERKRTAVLLRPRGGR
jgi:hypothetical protein